MSCGGTTRGNANAKCISEEVKSLNKRFKKRGTKRRATVALGQQDFHKLVAEEKKVRGLAAGSHTDQDEIEALARQRLPQRLEEIMNEKISADWDEAYEAKEQAEEQKNLNAAATEKAFELAQKNIKDQDFANSLEQDRLDRVYLARRENEIKENQTRELNASIALEQTRAKNDMQREYQERTAQQETLRVNIAQEQVREAERWQREYQERTAQKETLRANIAREQAKAEEEAKAAC